MRACEQNGDEKRWLKGMHAVEGKTQPFQRLPQPLSQSPGAARCA